MLTVVILTLNEAQHISRAIASVSDIADRIVVVDSGSTDQTCHIAKDLGAQVLVHPFVNQAEQFNWTLDQLPPDTDWVFRLDADEIVTPALAKSLSARLSACGPDITGAEVLRRIVFLGRPIKWGGLFPMPVLRVLRYGRGRSDTRWMDEHIHTDGPTIRLDGELLDDNLNPLSWWIDKHNAYATREAIQVLSDEEAAAREAGSAGTANANQKRNSYYKAPLFLRAFVYFLYRYVIRLGFLDGRRGLVFHFLQGFWYRFTVDAKIYETRLRLKSNAVTLDDIKLQWMNN